ILGDGRRAESFRYDDRLASSVQAGSIKRVQIVGLLKIGGLIAARRQVAQASVGDVGTITVSSVDCQIRGAPKSVRLHRTETLAFEEKCLGADRKWPESGPGCSLSHPGVRDVRLETEIIQTGDRRDESAGGVVHGRIGVVGVIV